MGFDLGCRFSVQGFALWDSGLEFVAGSFAVVSEGSGLLPGGLQDMGPLYQGYIGP